jgi:hypothetical protein
MEDVPNITDRIRQRLNVQDIRKVDPETGSVSGKVYVKQDLPYSVGILDFYTHTKEELEWYKR